MKIASIMDDMFEDSEFQQPRDAFVKKGHEVIVLGKKKGKTIIGKQNLSMLVDKAVKDASINDYDALLIPGGYSPDKLRADRKSVNFVKEFVMSGKPVFTICHGPQLLITAKVLQNREITGYKSIKQDIKNAGAKFVNKSVVIDENIVSSRNPKDLPDFIKASLKKMR